MLGKGKHSNAILHPNNPNAGFKLQASKAPVDYESVRGWVPTRSVLYNTVIARRGNTAGRQQCVAILIRSNRWETTAGKHRLGTAKLTTHGKQPRANQIEKTAAHLHQQPAERRPPATPAAGRQQRQRPAKHRRSNSMKKKDPDVFTAQCWETPRISQQIS